MKYLLIMAIFFCPNSDPTIEDMIEKVKARYKVRSDRVWAGHKAELDVIYVGSVPKLKAYDEAKKLVKEAKRLSLVKDDLVGAIDACIRADKDERIKLSKALYKRYELKDAKNVKWRDKWLKKLAERKAKEEAKKK